jgi:hypothetical protein
MNFSRSFTFAVALAALGTAQAGWNRSPYTETRPVDLAAMAIPGTKLVSSEGLGNPQWLIGSSLDEAVTLGAGKSSAVIQLMSQQNIHTAAFNNDGAEGKLTISGSADNKDWSLLGSAVFSAKDRVAQIYFAAATVKYVRASFDSAKGGTIRAFEVFGESTDRDFSMIPKDLTAGGQTVNLASAVSGARAIYAFPTPAHVGELNYLHGVFKFPVSREKYRTIIYDLGGVRTVKNFATSYSLRPMRVEVVAFDALPEKKDWRGKLTFDPAIFNTVKPVAVGEDAKGVGHLKITPEKAVTARYIALRFESNYQQDLAAGAEGESNGEFRYTKGHDDDMTVGGVEFFSDGGYQITPNSGNSVASVAKRSTGNDLVVAANTGYSQASTAAPSAVAPLASAPAQQNSQAKSSSAEAKNASVEVGNQSSKVASAAPTTGTTAPYVTSTTTSAEDTLLKSFTSNEDKKKDKDKEKKKKGDHGDHNGMTP